MLNRKRKTPYLLFDCEARSRKPTEVEKMRRNVVKVMMLVIAAVALGITGCGGGSGSLTPPTTQTPSTVSTSTFSGKSFAVTGGSLTFNADGTLSGMGINVANETWSVNSSGQLVT
jgi:hypothetical protein